MALDLYVGGWARYYSQQWENVAQAYAREEGIEYHQITVDGDNQGAEWAEVAEAVSAWLEALNQGLQSSLEYPVDWSEGLSAPYFTDRPGYDGWGALMILAAYAEQEQEPPGQLSEEWMADEVYLASLQPETKRQRNFMAITSANLWVPHDFMFAFDAVDLCNEQANISSTGLLLKSLEVLNEVTHNMTETEQEKYLDYTHVIEHGLQTLSRFALAMYIKLARQANDNKLPIIYSM